MPHNMHNTLPTERVVETQQVTTPRNGLAKEEIIRTATTIDALFARGRRGAIIPIRYVWKATKAENEKGTVSVLFSVPKKFFKRANKRNLLRRRIKESYRQAKHALQETALEKNIKVDIALIYSTKEIADYNTINNVVTRILEQIRERL